MLKTRWLRALRPLRIPLWYDVALRTGMCVQGRTCYSGCPAARKSRVRHLSATGSVDPDNGALRKSCQRFSDKPANPCPGFV